MSDTTHTLDESEHSRRTAATWVLVLAWVRDAQDRVGEAAVLQDTHVLGRGEDPGHLKFARLRPGRNGAQQPLAVTALSRRQLVLTVTSNGVTVKNEGRRALSVDGQQVSEAVLGAHSVIEVDRVLVAVLVRRAPWPAIERSLLQASFGLPDSYGVVGESVAAWTLRARAHWCGRRTAHVLITGPSGAGKELAARAIHAHSERAGAPFVARNASTLPASLVDAELFGHAAGYPQAGMPAREGLVGAADRGTLFLDEIGELPIEGQAHLLRLLDGSAEYHRLGETRARHADVRVVAATNREESELRHDLVPRFLLRLHVPPLQERREDIPLLIRELARQMMLDDPELAPEGIRIEPAFVSAMLRHTFTHHVRELLTYMWTALSEDPGTIALTASVAQKLTAPPASTEKRPPPTQAEIDAALEAHEGNRTRAAAALGISRFALLRRLKNA